MAHDACNMVLTHEKECAIRWKSATDTMKEIKAILAYGTVALLAAMLGLIGFLATHTIVH